MYAHLGTAPVENQAANHFDVTGTKPGEMGTHYVAETYTMLGITPEEFLGTHGGDTFDFNSVKLRFGDMCTDYFDALVKDVLNMSVQFA